MGRATNDKLSVWRVVFVPAPQRVVTIIEEEPFVLNLLDMPIAE
jgi:hypothetical protein